MRRRPHGDRRMTLVVRLLEDGDQGLLGRVAPEVFDHAVDPLLADAFLRDPRHHLVAAIADDRLVGFVSALDYWHPDKPRELWINEVGVAPPGSIAASERGCCRRRSNTRGRSAASTPGF